MFIMGHGQKESRVKGKAFIYFLNFFGNILCLLYPEVIKSHIRARQAGRDPGAGFLPVERERKTGKGKKKE